MRIMHCWGGPLDGATRAYEGEELRVLYYAEPVRAYFTAPDEALTASLPRRRWHRYLAAGGQYIYQGIGGD